MSIKDSFKRYSESRVSVMPIINSTMSHNLKNTVVLSLVPLVSTGLLLLLFFVFTKINLFYLESNGLILDQQVRDAYFQQMEAELFSVTGYLLLQVLVTAISSHVVLRWAHAPFRTAEETLDIAIKSPDKLVPRSRWLSESSAFDRFIWSFALRIKNGGPNNLADERLPYPVTNFLFLIKFYIVFSILSIVNGLVTGILLSSVYEKVVNTALRFVKQPESMSHYFLAQQEILIDATRLTTVAALLAYLFLGYRISNYMSKMILVFCTALKNEGFPIRLRYTDIYHELATKMNEGHDKIKSRSKAL